MKTNTHKTKTFRLRGFFMSQVVKFFLYSAILMAFFSSCFTIHILENCRFCFVCIDANLNIIFIISLLYLVHFSFFFLLSYFSDNFNIIIIIALCKNGKLLVEGKESVSEMFYALENTLHHCRRVEVLMIFFSFCGWYS